MTKLLSAVFLASALFVWLTPERPNLIAGIERVTLHKGRDGGVTWFLPRVCMVPQTGSRVMALMTLQTIAGSDYYGPVHWRESKDLGKTWSEPQPVPGFGRRPFSGEIEEAVSDVLPTYHAKTDTTLALGEIIYYRAGRYFPEQPPRYPVYAVRDAKGNWSERRKLVWDDPRTSAIYAVGSSQTVVLKNGDLLIPVSFRPKERADYAVTSLLCSFDGKELKVKRVGTTLHNTVKRGLLEPQLTVFDNRYLMTIRAEDGFGYVSTSTDGLTWSPAESWKWDNGQPLEMSTTQQHWLTHSEGLFLSYTRKAEENANVMRWRAPLYLAEVDRKTLRLIRSSEQIVFPLIGDGLNDPTHVPHYGNFHVNNVNADESWILAGEVIPANFRGDLLLARVKWKRPNRVK
ncbi:MAG: sialidase family protein [Acidobacteriota bacterium]